MIIVTWERHQAADTGSRRGYRWASTQPPADGVVMVPTAWAHRVDTITAEVTAAAAEQLGTVAVHPADDPAARAAAERPTGLVYLDHPAQVRDRFWVDVHAGHQHRLKIWRSEHHLGNVEYVLASSARHTLHRIDCPTMHDRVHGLDLMTRVRKLRQATELNKPTSIDPTHMDQLAVDAVLDWVWRGPRPHLLTAADTIRITNSATCQTCLPTYHLPGEQPLPLTMAMFDEDHLGREFTTGDGTVLGKLVAISRRVSRYPGGELCVETTLEFSTGHKVSLSAGDVLMIDTPPGISSSNAG